MRAGLGQIGKNGLVLNPTYGSWVAYQSIITDAALESDEPFTEVTLIALGSSTNDSINIDNVTIELPEPNSTGLVALVTLGLLRLRARRTRQTR